MPFLDVIFSHLLKGFFRGSADRAMPVSGEIFKFNPFGDFGFSVAA